MCEAGAAINGTNFHVSMWNFFDAENGATNVVRQAANISKQPWQCMGKNVAPIADSLSSTASAICRTLRR